MNAFTPFEKVHGVFRYAALTFLLAGLALTPQSANASEADTSILPPSQTQGTVIAESLPELDVNGPGFSEKYLRGKLRIGTRADWRQLTDADSGSHGSFTDSAAGNTLLGTIYDLDEEQNYLPFKFFIGYDFTKYFGIELAYDSYEAKTVASDGVRSDFVKTDGNLTLSGPVFSLIGRIPNSSAFTPYVGVGVAFYNSSFDEDPVWARTDNFSSAISVRTREMVVDNVTALILTAGVTWDLTQNWFLDCSVQAANADVDAVFEPSDDGQRSPGEDVPGHFPMDYVAIRLGIGYVF